METASAKRHSEAWVTALSAGVVLMSLVANGVAAPASRADASCATHCAAAASEAGDNAAPQDLAERWGIEVTAIRLSAHGNMIDFRYRVLDADKASALGKPSVKPVLVDHDNGVQLHVPSMPKVGQMRSTAQRLQAGRIYTALFTNPGGAVKKGHKVSVAFGDCRAENLVVDE